MTFKHAIACSISVALMAGSPMLSFGASQLTPEANLKWKDMGNGVKAAVVHGDMQKGSSRFFLKYPAGLVTPPHHHTADHHGTLISGRVTLEVDGKKQTLGAGSYFALSGKASHIARVEGSEDAVFFIQADGPWDAVMKP